MFYIRSHRLESLGEAMATQFADRESGRPLIEDEANYSKRLYDAVLDTVISLNAVPGTEAGYVSPDIVRIALTDVMVAVDFNCGLGRVPSERRKTGEYIGARYARLLKTFIDDPKCHWTPAMPVRQDGGRPN
jgi:thiazole synthase ThiGH ThiG subunit